ncbi:hypothetical protein OROGR_030470 [Orobanche gracilis]
MSGHSGPSMPREEGETSAAGELMPREPVVHIESKGYTRIMSPYVGSPGVESEFRPEAPVVLSVETAEEAVRASLDPREVEALFMQADAARAEEEALRREEADRVIALHLADDFDREHGEAYAEFSAMVDREYGEPRGFNFQAYLDENPYGRAPSRSFWVAAATTWSYNQIPSTVTLADLARYRTKYHIPSDVHLYAPASNEREDQAPDGLVAVDELIWRLGCGSPSIMLCLIYWSVGTWPRFS